MEINSKFEFGQYEYLTLLEVFQGTDNINQTLIKDYLLRCFKGYKVDKLGSIGLIEELIITENTISIVPQIFNEDLLKSDSNVVHFGNISSELENYFNCFFRKNFYGIVFSLEHFNSSYGPYLLGGDPEYIVWCEKKIENFFISSETKSKLENLVINRFIGLEIKMIGLNLYSYKQVFNKEKFKFKQ